MSSKSSSSTEFLEQKVASNPFDSELYLSLIDDYIEHSPEKVADMRTQFTSNLLPPSEFWLSWLTETSLNVSNDQKTVADIDTVFHQAIEDCPDRAIVLEYVDIISQLFEAEKVSETKMREVFELAVNLIGMDITEGGELWIRYRDFEVDEAQDLLETEAGADAIQDAKRRLLAVVRKQLAQPLKGNEQALAELDDILADICDEKDIDIINPAGLSDVFKKGVECREQRMLFEDNVTSIEFQQKSTKDRLVGWNAYISFEVKDNQLFRAQRLYDRAVLSCPNSHDLWRQYLHFASDTVKNLKLLDNVTRRAVRVPSCTSDIETWRYRFMALEIMTNKAEKASTAANGLGAGLGEGTGTDGEITTSAPNGLAVEVYGVLQSAMRSSFADREDYLTIMKLYCDVFRRSLSAAVTVGSTAVDIVSYVNNLTAALDFIENYLWTYFPDWAEGCVLYALYRCRIEDGLIEDISCSVEGEINGTPIVSKSTEVWDRVLAANSKHGRSYVVWKAAVMWAVATRKEPDYIRKLFKKAVVVFHDNTPVHFIHIDIFSCGHGAISCSSSTEDKENPQEVMYNKWLEFEEENGSIQAVQQVINRRSRALGQVKRPRKVTTTTAAVVEKGSEGGLTHAQKRKEKGASATKEDRNKDSRGSVAAEANTTASKKRGAASIVSSVTGIDADSDGSQDMKNKKAKKDNTKTPTTTMTVNTTGTEENGGKKEDDEKNTKYSVFVKNLAFSATETDIRQAFQDCGHILGVELILNTTGKFKGMAYVHFKASASVDKAMFKHNTEVAGRPMTVEVVREGSNTVGGLAQTGGDEEFHPNTVFVSKLPRSVDLSEDELRECFLSVAVAGGGEIQDIKIVRDKRSGHCKGHALVEFSNSECVKLCLNSSEPFKIHKKVVDVGPSKFPVAATKQKPPANKYLSESASSGSSSGSVKKGASISLSAMKPRGLKVKVPITTKSGSKSTPATNSQSQDVGLMSEESSMSKDKVTSKEDNGCSRGVESTGQQEGKTNSDFRAFFQ